MFALMDIFWCNEQLLYIAFRNRSGMLFVTEFEEAVLLERTGIAVLTRSGLAADLSFFVDFYRLTLFAISFCFLVASITAADT